MATYRIWLSDPLREVAKNKKVPIVRKLEEWFDPIAKAAGFANAQGIFPQYQCMPKQHELLIYIVPSMMSVVQNMRSAQRLNFPNPRSSPHQGVTVIGPPAGSEIWMKVSSVDAITSLVFHEAMHNKLQLGNSLHSKFAPCKLSCASITWPTSPSPAESQAMAAALKNPVPQWREGQAILYEARIARKAGDPEWNIQLRER